MRIGLKLAALRTTRWYEYAIRFLFGGLITVIAELVAQRWGPRVGGLLLAFPAIFPASATLVEKHERQKKQRVGLNGAKRGRNAAGLDAAGAAIGSIGLMAFALAAWRLLPAYPAAAVLASATMLWIAASGVLWRIRKAI
jgi:hypothetical protein